MGTNDQARELLPRTSVAPEDVAIEVDGRSRTNREVDDRARRGANLLRSLGLEAGDRWALLAHNRVEWPELVLANARAGTRVVPTNWHLGPGEIRAILDTAGAEVLVADPELATLAEEAAGGSGSPVRRIVALDDEYEQLLAAESDEPLPEGPTGSPLMFTGGTTGPSKGVNRSDSGASASDALAGYRAWAGLVGCPEEGIGLITTPLYHALGLAALGSFLANGSRIVAHRRFDPEQTLATIEAEGVTSAPMVPTQFVRLLKLDDEVRDRYDVSTVEWILHTAAPCPAWAKRAMIDWFGPVVVELYGSSEGLGPVVCTSREWLDRPGTVGRPAGRLELSIVGDDGDDLPPGEIGTVYGRRADGAPEYDGDPEKTRANRLPDGRFTVGDVGWLDEDGFLYLADRRVDLILRGGSNIYPAEIEAVLTEHPAVGDAAVFGIPDPEWGQKVKAVVEPSGVGSVDPAELQRWVGERLASFKVPATVDVVDALPREAHGKLKKRLLRDPYWEGVRS